MQTQDQINADVAAISGALTKISADQATLVTGIEALKTQLAGGTPVDLSQLDALATQATSVQASADAAVSALAPAAPATPPTETPAA